VLDLNPENKIAGVLAPVFAIRGHRDLGVGDTEALRELISWTARQGLSVVLDFPAKPVKNRDWMRSLIAQANVAFNIKKGTLRGMHFQFPPAPETKLVRCTRGAILDIIVDLRPESATYLQHISVELNEENQRSLYVPERFAHGYQALRDNTDTSYQVGEF